MRVAGPQFSRIAVVVLALACAGRPGELPSGFDIASEFAKVTSAQAELSTTRENLDSAQTGTPGPDVVPGSADVRLRQAQAAFDSAYARSQKVLARFLNVALNEAPGRPETRQALDFYARDAVSNGRYAFEHGGDRTAVIKALADAKRAYLALGLGVPCQLASAMEELRRTPPPIAQALATPSAAGVGGPASSHRRRDRHPAGPNRSQTPL
jgi:hypothetical protein